MEIIKSHERMAADNDLCLVNYRLSTQGEKRIRLVFIFRKIDIDNN